MFKPYLGVFDRMGIKFSNSPHAEKEDILRLPTEHVEKAVESYVNFQLPPLLDHNGYKFFIMLALSDVKNDAFAIQVSQAYWQIFAHQGSCSTQEVLVCMIWLCNGTWNQKFAMIFDVFKSLGSEDMGRDDMILATDVVITSLSRLWVYDTKREEEESAYERMRRVTEDVADRAFLKMDKDMEEMVNRSDFMKWALLKFVGSERRGTRNTCSLELSSAFDVEYNLLNELLFVGEDSDDDDGDDDEQESNGDDEGSKDEEVMNGSNSQTSSPHTAVEKPDLDLGVINEDEEDTETA